MREILIKIKFIAGLFLTALLLIAFYYSYDYWNDSSEEPFVGQRGPYLQSPSDTAITIRWRSKHKEQSTLYYAETETDLSQMVLEQQERTEHEIRLTDLQANTRYFYTISAPDAEKQIQTTYWFKTSPEPHIAYPTRFIVLGDPGRHTRKQKSVLKATLTWLDKNTSSDFPYIDFLMTTGDNAYTSGTDRQFQKHFFQPLENILVHVPVWPGYGNHDARSDTFFDIFTLPLHDESGGEPSGTERYYSFNYANTHIIMLDSNNNEPDSLSTMLDWLDKDLIGNTNANWLIAVFHHPPYTKGSHDSDDVNDSGGKMFVTREQIIPRLEKAGVDLIINGHSHSYERSFLLHGHYGTSSTLKSQMILDKSKDAIFEKPESGKGTIYAVVGSSTFTDPGNLNHPVMQVSFAVAGALVVEVNDKILSGHFVNDKGNALDTFKIIQTK